jgi:hypothetical protein
MKTVIGAKPIGLGYFVEKALGFRFFRDIGRMVGADFPDEKIPQDGAKQKKGVSQSVGKGADRNDIIMFQ